MDYIFGDLHAMTSRDYSCKLFENITSFFKLFANNTLTKSDNVFFLGDLYNHALNDGATVKIVYDIVSSVATRCNKVYILTGNHDLIQSYARIQQKTDNALVSLSSIENVCLIKDKPEEVVTNTASYYCMPYLSGKLSTESFYNAFEYPKDRTYDYALGHWTIAGTMKFVGGVDVSKIPAKNIICGHVHSRIDSRYLGSVWPCDRSQYNPDNPPVYAKISKDKCEYITLPTFIRFFTVKSTDMPVRPKSGVIDVYYIEVENGKMLDNFKNCYIARVSSEANESLLLLDENVNIVFNTLNYKSALTQLVSSSQITDKVYKYCLQVLSKTEETANAE